MPQVERDIVTAAMMRGFVDCATEAGTSVTGGQTVLGPWPTLGEEKHVLLNTVAVVDASPVDSCISRHLSNLYCATSTTNPLGGVATSLRHESEFLRPENIAPGDVLVLTKPLGTQLAVNLWQWRAKPERWARVEAVATLELAAEAYDAACESMGRLNLNAARCMHTYGAHGGTDVTGFGILGHARNWAQHAAQRVHVTLTALPIIRGMVALDDALSGNFKLRAGLSPETSGGLLIALPTREAAAAFIEGVRAADGQPAWVVGHVSAALPGKNSDADVSADVTIIEV